MACKRGVRLRINHHDDPVKWAALIRAHIEAYGGRCEWERRMSYRTTIDPTTGARER